MCTLAIGPVTFKCGHTKQESSVVFCSKNCGHILGTIPVPKSTKRAFLCLDCKSKVSYHTAIFERELIDDSKSGKARLGDAVEDS